MIRPTTIPQTLQELILEQAIAREALRLAFEQHKQLAVELRGACSPTTHYLRGLRSGGESGQTLVSMPALDMDCWQWWRFITRAPSSASIAHDDGRIPT